LPTTLTFKCPSEDCAPPKETKPFCEEKKEECVSVGKPSKAAESTKATQMDASCSCGSDPAPTVRNQASGPGNSSAGGKCGNSDNCCDIKPLSMVRII